MRGLGSLTDEASARIAQLKTLHLSEQFYGRDVGYVLLQGMPEGRWALRDKARTEDAIQLEVIGEVAHLKTHLASVGFAGAGSSESSEPADSWLQPATELPDVHALT